MQLVRRFPLENPGQHRKEEKEEDGKDLQELPERVDGLLLLLSTLLLTLWEGSGMTKGCTASTLN